MKSLANTDTSNWPNGFVKVYLTNLLVNIQKERCIENLRKSLGRDVICMYAKDSGRDVKMQTFSVTISDNQIHIKVIAQVNLPGLYWSKTHVSY